MTMNLSFSINCLYLYLLCFIHVKLEYNYKQYADFSLSLNLGIMEKNIYDVRFKHNACMMVAGPSYAGKTVFLDKLIQHRHILFDEPLKNVYWFYGVEQPLFHRKLREEGIILEEGLPKSFEAIKPYSMIIMDDLMSEIPHSKAVTSLFTRIAHHRHCFVIMVTQNMFSKDPHSRTQHLNTQYLVTFKNPRDSLQIRTLGSQMFPGKKGFLPAVFENATAQPHSYLLIDSHQETNDAVRLRSRIFLNETPMIAYQQKS